MTRYELDIYAKMKEKYPESFKVDRVFEGGSMDINGTVRGFFDAKEYVGIDWRSGKSVDVVSLIHEYQEKPNGYFDTAISGATLEHDPYWKKSIKRMIELIKPNGTLILVWANRNFDRHCIEASPIENYYEGLDYDKIIKIVVEYEFEIVWGSDDKKNCTNNISFLFLKNKK